MLLFKSTKVSERFTLQFRVDTNTLSMGWPSNNGAFDQVDNPNPFAASYVNVDSGTLNRQPLFLNLQQLARMQLGLKLVW